MDPSAVTVQNSTKWEENTGKWGNHHGGHILAWCAPRAEWFGGKGPIFVSHHGPLRNPSSGRAEGRFIVTATGLSYS